MNVFRAINRWVRPYMYDDEIKIPKKERKETKKQVKLTKITKAHKKPTELEAVKRGQLGVKLITLKEVLDKDSAFQRLDKSDSHIAYYFHSSNKHQIAVRFEPQSGFRYYKRNDIKRKNFKPLIYPKYESSDKTHLIPVGFHGSENDPRLLIGWSSKLNRGGIKKHEEKVININQNHTIYWFVDVEKHRDSGGAYWTSTVWFEDGSLLDEKKFYDKSKFHWSE
ncbi:hypothetical protein PZN54_11100 [Staphylococcus capitis]|uniref:Uncharacterized protein n=1 Tax=Staphylococcus warneri TaxID=1292 RepID=A0A8B2ZNC5_STAWA|nr:MULTISPECIES: hypothetical protein [Staphylococcus]MCG1060635.1 hypothetical protein [Staphylococcus epidermidis]MDH9600739.1 hypothetical protein [Staphylococcus capitis]MDH9624347.1 hypothetical protein [Staphylococcus capitis]RGM28319.1 hypothetical protein DXC19_11585 [Staphylococcus warneri]